MERKDLIVPRDVEIPGMIAMNGLLKDFVKALCIQSNRKDIYVERVANYADNNM